MCESGGPGAAGAAQILAQVGVGRRLLADSPAGPAELACATIPAENNSQESSSHCIADNKDTIHGIVITRCLGKRVCPQNTVIKNRHRPRPGQVELIDLVTTATNAA